MEAAVMKKIESNKCFILLLNKFILLINHIRFSLSIIITIIKLVVATRVHLTVILLMIARIMLMLVSTHSLTLLMTSFIFLELHVYFETTVG